MNQHEHMDAMKDIASAVAKLIRTVLENRHHITENDLRAMETLSKRLEAAAPKKKADDE